MVGTLHLVNNPLIASCFLFGVEMLLIQQNFQFLKPSH